MQFGKEKNVSQLNFTDKKVLKAAVTVEDINFIKGKLGGNTN